MAGVAFNVTVEGADDDSQVRLWVEDSRSLDLDGELEILMECVGGRWTGTFDLPPDWRSILVRVAVTATPGHRWHLRISRMHRPRRLLIADSDLLVSPKEWIVTTCPAV